jgi:type II restriction enzyme
MNLEMSTDVAFGLKSASQVARRITEGWAAENLYCPACPADRLACTPHNTKAVDFRCTGCGVPFQLKAGRGWSEARIPDAGYHAMIESIRSDAVPNLVVMQYSPEWRVQNLLVVPSFFFTEAAIERRAPLAPTARRAGWIGCNILLREIASDGKLRIVQNLVETPSHAVRSQYDRIRALAELRTNVRGWTLDVLQAVKRLNARSFSLAEIYEREAELAAKHPRNNNVRPKIRQQLQILRDLGLIRFDGAGRYSLN